MYSSVHYPYVHQYKLLVNLISMLGECLVLMWTQAVCGTFVQQSYTLRGTMGYL